MGSGNKLKTFVINIKNSCILLLTLFLWQAPALLLAGDHVDYPGSRFTVLKYASVNIGESATITISNLHIESNITGRGKLILLSDNNALINANNHSIENLVLASANKVELLSGLRIINELTILKGELHLNDFDLLIGPNTILNQSTLSKIILNGSGVIVQQSIGIPYAAGPFTFSGPVQFDFSVFPAIATANRSISCEHIFYYRPPIIPNRTPDVLVPPPKAA